MEKLISALKQHPDLTPPSELLEGGALPALLTGLSAVHRAHWFAWIWEELRQPMVVVTPDEITAATLAADLESLTDQPVQILASREMALYGAEGVSRQGERQRLAALDALAGGRAPVTVIVSFPAIQPASTTPTAIPSGMLWRVTASTSMVVRFSRMRGPSGSSLF